MSDPSTARALAVEKVIKRHAEKPLHPSHLQRLALVRGNFDLPEETLKAMRRVRAAYELLALELADVFASAQSDGGRVTATYDLIQQGKDVACCALILPHGPATGEAFAKALNE